MKLKLIYFQKCSQVENVKKIIREAGCEAEEILQDELDYDDPYLQYSSPSILINDDLIYGKIVHTHSDLEEFQIQYHLKDIIV